MKTIYALFLMTLMISCEKPMTQGNVEINCPSCPVITYPTNPISISFTKDKGVTFMTGYIAPGSSIMTIKHDSQGEMKTDVIVNVYNNNLLIQTLSKEMFIFSDGTSNITGFNIPYSKGIIYQVQINIY